MQPRSCSTKTLNSGYVAEELIRFMHNNTKCTRRGKKGKVKNEHVSRKRLHASWVTSLKKKKGKKKIKFDVMHVKMCAGDQASEGGVEGEEGEGASVGVFGSPEYSAERDSLASSSLGMSKLKSKPG